MIKLKARHKTFLLSFVICTAMVFMTGLSNFSQGQTKSQTFNTSGTFTVPGYVSSVTVECWGGGGGGGGQALNSDGGGGGGGGAYSKKQSITVTPGVGYTVNVGAGGNGGVAANGSSGGDSYFINTSTVLAKGGAYGSRSTGTPPNGGLGGAAASGVGDTKYSGGQGEKGRNNNAGIGGYGGSSAGTGANGYSGPQTWSTNIYPTASTPTGGGHGGNGGAAGADGSAGTAPGGGGGGSGDGNPRTGGRGANGRVVIYWESGFYRSKSTGDWDSPSTWEVSGDGINWFNSTDYPDETAKSITIRNGHTVTITSSVGANQLTIDTGGQISVNSGQNLTVVDGTGTDLNVSGTLSNSGTVTVVGTIQFNSGGTYVHAQNGGVIPSALWNAASNCNITGVISTVPTGFDQTFGNLTWNCPSQAGNLYLAANVNIAGNFTVSGTGATDPTNNSLRLSDTSTGYTMAIAGDFILSNNSAFKMNNNAGSCTMNVAGNFTLNSGNFTIVSGTANSTVNVEGNVTVAGATLVLMEDANPTTGTLNVKGNFTFSGGTITNLDATGTGAITFNGTTTQRYSRTGGTIAAYPINFTVNSGSILDVGTSIIDGSTGTFMLSSGSGIITAHSQGLSTTAATGSIQVTGTKTYSSGANYTYNGVVNQSAGNGLTGANNLTINNTGSAGNNTVSLASNVAISGNLSVTSGILDIGTYTANRTASGGTLTIAGTLALGGTTGGQTGSNFPTNFAALTMAGGTVNYNNGNGGQTVFSTPTYNNLTLGNTAGIQTAGGNLTVNGALLTTAGSTLNMTAAYTLSGTLSAITNNGTISTAVPTTTSAVPIPAGKTWGGTIVYAANAGAQTIVPAVSYNNLTLSNTGGINTAGGNIVVNGTLTTTAGGTLNMTSGYTLSGTLSTITNNGTINTAVVTATSSVPIPSGKTWGGTIIYSSNSGSQTIVAGTYGILTLNNTSGTNTAGGNITATTLNTTASGTLNMVAYTLGVTNVTNAGTIRTQNTSASPISSGKIWGGTFIFDASSGQTIPSSTFNNLTLNNAGGATLSAPATVNGIFSLSNGKLTTTVTNLLSVTNTATTAISGGSSSAFINGPVKWNLPANLASGSTYSFPIGKGTTYLPFSLVNPTTGTGVITAQVEAFATGSGGSCDAILQSISSSEYWSMATSGNFTSSSLSLTRPTTISPLDAISGSILLAGPYTNLEGTPGTTGISASNDIGAFRFFALAVKKSIVTTISITGSPFCAGSSGVSVPFTYTPKANFSGATFTAQLSDAVGSFTSPVTLQSVASNGSGSQSLNVTIPLSTPAGSGYRIRIVSTNPEVIGTDNGADITVSGAVPAQPAAISGSTSPCANTTGVTYSVPNVSGVVYNWTLPSGWTQTGGGTSNSITVTTGSASGDIQVIPSNACGSGSARTLAVTVIPGPVFTVQPSTTPQSLCQNGTTTALSVTASGTGLSYQWYQNTTSTNSGGTLIDGATSSTYTPLSRSTGTSYYYCVVSGNCAPPATSDVSGAVTIIVPQALVPIPASRCGTGTVGLSVTSSACFSPTINWFAAATGGTSLGTGTSFTTPSISATTTYYAQETFYGGIITPGSTSLGTNLYGLAFDLNEPIVLNTVQINAIAAGNVTIQLQNNTGGVISTTASKPVVVGLNTITLNWTIPAGTGYRLLKTAGVNLGTNSQSIWPVGFEVGSITNSIESGAVNAARYDYFYNWNISRVRVPVVARVGSPIVTGFSGSTCGPGTVVLGASTTGGTISWFSTSTGGTALTTGTSYSPNLSATTTYYVEAKDLTCTSSPRVPVVATVISKPSITAGGAGTYCSGSTVNLTSSGSGLTNRYWTGPNGFYSLLENPVLTGVTSAMTGKYTVIGSALSGVNLVTNGDFESGDVGFGSSYVSSSDLQPEGRYSVVADPKTVHNSFVTCNDHSPTGTMQMVINGATVANVNVWSQTVNVVPNTDYQYTYWIQSVVAQNPAQLQLYINGSPAGPVYTADLGTCSFKQFTYNWNSGSATSAYLSLVNQNTIAGGNDFAIDDIVFQPACTTESPVVLNPDPNGPGDEYANFGVIYVTVSEDPTAGAIGTNQSICSGSTPATLTSITAGTGSGTITYEWQADAGSGYSVIAGATSATYSPPALAVTTSYRRRTVTNNKGTVCISPYTASVTITVNSAATANAGGLFTGLCQAAIPSPIILSGSSVGGSATTGAWSIVSGGGSLSNYSQTASPASVTYTPAADYSGTVVLRLTTNNVGGCMAIDDRTLIIDPKTTIDSQSTAAQSQCINGTFTPISLTVTGANLSYQWYSNTSASTSGGISLGSANGAQTNIYTPQSGIAGTLYYYCVVSGNCGIATSAVSGAFVVTPLPSATISYPGNPFCSNLGIASVSRTGTPGGVYTADPAGLSINAGTGAITTASSTPGTYTVTYTVAAAGGCSVFSTTCQVTVILDGLWTGSSSTDWNATGNWACNQLPTLTSDVIIPTGKTNYPTLSSGSPGMSKNLSIQNSSSVTVAGNTLQIAGAITNNGTLNATAGTVEMKGSSAQTIPAGTFVTNTIMNLTINNASGVTLQGALKVTDIVKVISGNLSSGGNLTLISTVAKTALIDGSGTGQVTGNVIIQRYLASGFGYKYFSSPFQGATVSQFSPWVNLSASFPAFYGYDENNKSSSDEAVSGWVKYVNPSGTLIPTHGYSANFGTAAVPVTVSLSGAVNNGTLAPLALTNHNMTYTKGFNLVGNPYPSPIDWDSPNWIRTNVDDAIYFFSASTPGADANANDSLQYQGTYSSYVNGYSTDGATGIIPAMQAFFVHVPTFSPTNGSITFNNGIRVNNLTAVFKSAYLTFTPLVRLKAGYDGNFADNAVIYFDNSATTFFDGKLDALKMMNTDYRVPSLYFKSADAKLLSIDARPFPQDSMTRIPIGLKIPQNGTIKFEITELSQMLPGYRVYLEDVVKGVYSEIGYNSVYQIPLKAGIYESRFSLVFSSKELTSESPNSVEKFTLVPTGGIWVINLKLGVNETGVLQLSNMRGQVLFRRQVIGNESVELNYKGSSGVYIISLISGKEIFSKKVIIQNK